MRNSVCQSEARGEMTKAPIALQELRRRIYRKGKSEKAHRVWGIFVHVTRKETLEEAYRIAMRNGGAAGIDGQTFETIETAGLNDFLADIKDDQGTGKGQNAADSLHPRSRGAGGTEANPRSDLRG